MNNVIDLKGGGVRKRSSFCLHTRLLYITSSTKVIRSIIFPGDNHLRHSIRVVSQSVLATRKEERRMSLQTLERNSPSPQESVSET